MLEGKSVFFPTHACCRRILEAVLHPPNQNAEAAPTLNLKALYEAMCLLSEMFTAQLTVNYGEFEGNVHFWECLPGEEASLAPTFRSNCVDKH